MVGTRVGVLVGTRDGVSVVGVAVVGVAEVGVADGLAVEESTL